MYLHASYAKRDEDHGPYDLTVYVDDNGQLRVSEEHLRIEVAIGERGDAKASIDALVEALTCLRAQIEATDKIRAGRAAA
jgi:predicted nucleotidyltransferase